MATKGGLSRKERTQAHRDNIKTTKILNRMQNHLFGIEDGMPAMDSGRIRIAEVLLRKTVPDQKMVDAIVDGHLTLDVIEIGGDD